MIKKVAKLLVSVFFLVLAIYLLDWQKVAWALKKLDPYIFLLAIGISFIQFLVMAFRWYGLIKRIAPLPFVKIMDQYMYGAFLNTFTPANLGGDVYRLMVLRERANGALPVFSMLVRERLLGLLSFFLVYIGCALGEWIFRPQDMLSLGKSALMTGMLSFAGVSLILLMPFIVTPFKTLPAVQSRKRIADLLDSFGRAARFTSVSEFVSLMGLSVAAIFIWIAAVYLISGHLGLSIPLPLLGAVVIIVELVRLVPVTIQGIGLREGMYAYLIGLLGKSSEAGFILGVSSYLALSLSILLCGLASIGLSRYYLRNGKKVGVME